MLTPLEMHCLQAEQSLVDLYLGNRIAVVNESDEVIYLEGRPLMEDGLSEAPWTIKATLDRKKQLLPVRVSSHWPITNDVYSDAEMRTTGTSVISGVHVISKAIMLYRKSTMDHWGVCLYRANAIERDDSITSRDLEIELPERQYRLVDDLSGVREIVDEAGRVTHRQVLTPAEIQETRQATKDNLAATANKIKLLDQRKNTFLTIVGVSACLGAALIVIRVRRHRRSVR